MVALPIVSYEPDFCSHLATFVIKEEGTMRDVPFITVNAPLNTHMTVQTNDALLLGTKDYLIYAYNELGESYLADRFTINFVDSCGMSDLKIV